MSELEEATRLLSQLVNVSLQNTFGGEPEPDEPSAEPALPTGQYL